MEKIRVCASVSYDVLIGNGLLDQSGKLIRDVLGECRLAVLTDETVGGLYLERLLASTGDCMTFIIKPGEQSKTTDNAMLFIQAMSEAGITRSDAVIALGGGVVGDLAGFAASVYMRGIPFVQIPTTLLAAVDSSVGGKTAVDTSFGKNLVGTFHQPSLVICDTDALTKRDGYAEVIKYAFLSDPGLLECPFQELISRCVSIKRDIVQSDEYDRGQRALLNFGHTVGHAIEKLSGFEIPHGNAVAQGMYRAAKIGRQLGLEDCTEAIQSTLEEYGFDLSCPYSARQIYETAMADKKREGDFITLVLPESIGKCGLFKLPVAQFLELLEKTQQC